MTPTPTQAQPLPLRRVAGGDTPPVTACLIEIDMDHPENWQPSAPEVEPVTRNNVAAKLAERMQR